MIFFLFGEGGEVEGGFIFFHVMKMLQMCNVRKAGHADGKFQQF